MISLSTALLMRDLFLEQFNDCESAPGLDAPCGHLHNCTNTGGLSFL